jgi:SNF2 family DNA or RNA helicase
MLPQPRLRFLLADEPGTGKTIMAGMYLREMQRLGFVKRGLVICPAYLVEKWRADFARFFGGGLRRITAATVREGALAVDHDLWVTSLDLASVNAMVQEAIRPDRAGWDVVVIDEAHRMTPSAQAYYQVGRLMSRTPRVVLMAATPHRGKEALLPKHRGPRSVRVTHGLPVRGHATSTEARCSRVQGPPGALLTPKARATCTAKRAQPPGRGWARSRSRGLSAALGDRR